MVNTQNLKGVNDYYGKEQLARNKIINILKSNFEHYGYMPLDSSILYNYDLLAYKYHDGAEILSEIYKLSDQGNRELALRYDLTVPFCKVISNIKDLRLPFKRYEIGKVFRNGPVKTGRLREFYQCDIDVVGIDGTDIEIEQILLVINCFNKLGIDILIKWNNRKLMSGLIKYVGIEESKTDEVIGIIDKLEKVSREELKRDFLTLDISEEIVDKLLDIFSKDINYFNEIKCDDAIFTEGLNEANEFNDKLNKLGLNNNTKFSASLARGLSIYTGVVFEFFDKLGRLTCSLGGGGRYNKIITDFINNGETYPAVGLSFGLEPIYAILKDELINDNLTDIYIIPMDTELESLVLAEKLRQNGKNVIVELNKRKVKKCFEFANRENIKYVIVLGSNEVENKIYSLKNMKTGEQVQLKEEELLEFFK